MKLQAKLALFNTLSKILMILAAVLILPTLINRIAIAHTDQQLKKKEEQVREIIKKVGIAQFIKSEQDSAFASYNLLKEEFISLEPAKPQTPRVLTYNAKRNLEEEIVDYRILDHYFKLNGKYYLLEIGRSLEAVQERYAMLRTLAFILLLSIAVLTVFSDLLFARFLLSPLERIINTKLRDVHHPATFNFTPIQTSTYDFRYLDNSINEMMGLLKTTFEKEREFMSNVAHELLTPISILQNRFENILQEESLSEANALKLIESQKTLSRLKNIIKSLLLISKIENDQFVKTDPIDLKLLLNEVAEEVEDRLESKHLSLETEINEPLPKLEGNQSLLFTMFFNLVNNAIKYNHENGRIHIKGFATATHYVVEIKDTGIGISAEAQATIFNRFKRATSQQSHESYGLGLPIVQTIARFHQMEIKVVSEVEKGTVISVLIPKV